MKLKSNRTLILALILTCIAGLVTIFDYLEKIHSDASGPNDYFELSNYQGSPEPTIADQWLYGTTSSSADPKAGAIFINLFEQGQMNQSVDVDYSYLEDAPNLIYASLVNTQWEAGQDVPPQTLYQRIKQAPWHLEVSWNSPKEVFTQDKVKLQPETVSFWSENDQLRLAVDNHVLVVDDDFSQQLESQVKQALTSKQTQSFDDSQVSFTYPEGCSVESNYNARSQVNRYQVVCPRGEQAGVCINIVPKESVEQYNLGGLNLKQRLAQEISVEASEKAEVVQKQEVEVNGSRLETVTRTEGRDFIVATSVDADLLESVVSSIEIK